MAEFAWLAVGTVALRPYVFGFFLLYLFVAVAELGWRRAVAFTGLAFGLAFAAELSSTRNGIPFGLYHYTGATRGRELFLANVPLMDSLSFTFLAYAGLGLARLLVGAARRGRLGLVSGLLFMLLDVVIDPLAVRGDRWFLGRIFYYPEGGPYFGVPFSNFAGWLLLGWAIVGGYLALAPRLGGSAPAWGRRLPGLALYGPALYYLVLVFNLVVTWTIDEPGLFWAGFLIHLPLTFLVVARVGGMLSYRTEPTG